jgi:hypothetical protein
VGSKKVTGCGLKNKDVTGYRLQVKKTVASWGLDDKLL